MTKDQVIGALIGIVRATDQSKPDIHTFNTIVEGLQAEDQFNLYYKKAMEEKFRLVPDCAVCKTPCGRTFNLDMQDVYEEVDEELKQYKLDLLNDLIMIAKNNPPYSQELETLIYDGLFAIGDCYVISQFEDIKQRIKKCI